MKSRGASLSKAPGHPPGDRGIDSAARSSLSQPGSERARAKSQCLQAFTAGLHQEAAGFAAGLRDGEEGANLSPLPDWSPERLRQLVSSGDQVEVLAYVFSYLLGRQRGQQFPGRKS